MYYLKNTFYYTFVVIINYLLCVCLHMIWYGYACGKRTRNMVENVCANYNTQIENLKYQPAFYVNIASMIVSAKQGNIGCI